MRFQRERIGRQLQEIDMAEQKLEYLTPGMALELVRDIIRYQAHGVESLDSFIDRAIDSTFALDKALATSARLNQSP
ncbi:hypothetical protein [Burkholderia sp. AW49-1]